MARTGFIAGLVGVCAVAANTAFAASPIDIQRSLEAEARQATSGFAGFSAQRGEQLFNVRHGDWSCATCHTADPRQPGAAARLGGPAMSAAAIVDEQLVTDGNRRAVAHERRTFVPGAFSAFMDEPQIARHRTLPALGVPAGHQLAVDRE